LQKKLKEIAIAAAGADVHAVRQVLNAKSGKRKEREKGFLMISTNQLKNAREDRVS